MFAPEKHKANLPHGSGINGDWGFSIRGETSVFSNIFYAMNEDGMYCHNYYFEVEYKWSEENLAYQSIIISFDECECECGYGLQEYLEDTMPENI